MRRYIFLLLLGLFFVVGCELATQANPTLRLGLPIDCTLGKDCFVLLYPDRDPGPEAVDFGCGRMTYDGHKGTDFAISDEQEEVTVKASAAGTVLRTRNNIRDRRIQDQTQTDAVEGMECGNGVVIEHDESWQTQYCHLRQGSVLVQPGDKVKEGTPLGLVGTSGKASFPHVHLSVRYQDKVIDPFTGPEAQVGCQGSKSPLWNLALPYQSTGLIRAGFATQLPKLEQLWDGDFKDQVLPIDSSALVFWVHTYGMLKGDQERLQLQDPQGKMVAQFNRPVSESQKVWTRSLGKKGTQQPLIPGRWSGRYQLIRDKKVIIDHKEDVLLK
ncbi:M23 family metallopeptidase [Acaryochloris sp. 'Moss Beach']|uniref:M23 family metallopeptidase n=1 Tax=Acaryochloris sp. 'Moss Beach' TaxID=2740837 RepID=UPI001F3D5DE1|nr:M23 family metallopeptidase [Acaryochloris sp. 'Moss Beach']UJB69790.1 M23 family metallopeptidase [Acaryochloris sp. 'Moss Beach']